jgi:small GTP-binding protein
MPRAPPFPDTSVRQRKRLKLLVLGAAGAGKTSLLRRYFYKHFEYERMPTLGSDLYVGKVPIPSSSQSNPEVTEGSSNGTASVSLDAADSPSVYVNVQMWDTPGKENFALERQRHVQYSATLSDSFFQHADAIMLVYDMTSSTSFTRLLKWYGDLMELFAKTGKAWPILIVANKLDLYQTNLTLTQKENSLPTDDAIPTLRPVVTQRDVLGLHGKDYYGKNFQYEYQICLADEKESDESDRNGHSSASHSTSSLGGNNPVHRRGHTNKRRMEISTYLVRNRDNWTTDGSYLESLLQSEDGSHPDRDMVMLWCIRNRLRLVEVSAATGEGVNEAVEALIALALEPTEDAAPAPMPPPRQVNEELDLHHRFSKKKENCFFCLPSIRDCCNR